MHRLFRINSASRQHNASVLHFLSYSISQYIRKLNLSPRGSIRRLSLIYTVCSACTPHNSLNTHTLRNYSPINVRAWITSCSPRSETQPSVMYDQHMINIDMRSSCKKICYAACFPHNHSCFCSISTAQERGQ